MKKEPIQHWEVAKAVEDLASVMTEARDVGIQVEDKEDLSLYLTRLNKAAVKLEAGSKSQTVWKAIMVNATRLTKRLEKQLAKMKTKKKTWLIEYKRSDKNRWALWHWAKGTLHDAKTSIRTHLPGLLDRLNKRRTKNQVTVEFRIDGEPVKNISGMMADVHV